jgi:hypothetical protein
MDGDNSNGVSAAGTSPATTDQAALVHPDSAAGSSGGAEASLSQNSGGQNSGQTDGAPAGDNAGTAGEARDVSSSVDRVLNLLDGQSRAADPMSWFDPDNAGAMPMQPQGGTSGFAHSFGPPQGQTLQAAQNGQQQQQQGGLPDLPKLDIDAIDRGARESIDPGAYEKGVKPIIEGLRQQQQAMQAMHQHLAQHAQVMPRVQQQMAQMSRVEAQQTLRTVHSHFDTVAKDPVLKNIYGESWSKATPQQKQDRLADARKAAQIQAAAAMQGAPMSDAEAMRLASDVRYAGLSKSQAARAIKDSMQQRNNMRSASGVSAPAGTPAFDREALIRELDNKLAKTA